MLPYYCTGPVSTPSIDRNDVVVSLVVWEIRYGFDRLTTGSIRAHQNLVAACQAICSFEAVNGYTRSMNLLRPIIDTLV